jgi:hypothetical protein
MRVQSQCEASGNDVAGRRTSIGRCRAARRTGPAAPRAAVPGQGRAKSPPTQNIDLEFERASSFSQPQAPDTLLANSAVRASEVALDRARFTPWVVAIVAMVYCPDAYISRATCSCGRSAPKDDNPGGRRPWPPASPAAVCSRMRSRSNSARAARTWKRSLPPGVVVSYRLLEAAEPIPRSASSVMVSTRCRSDRPSRSSFQTTRVSPGRSWSKSCSRVGRSLRAPLAAGSGSCRRTSGQLPPPRIQGQTKQVLHLDVPVVVRTVLRRPDGRPASPSGTTRTISWLRRSLRVRGANR